jgi:hypothetical protein
VLLVLVVGLVAHANYRIHADETLAIDAVAPGRFISVEGRQQHFVVHGDPAADPTGAPVMFIHGFIVSGHTTALR